MPEVNGRNPVLKHNRVRIMRFYRNDRVLNVGFAWCVFFSLGYLLLPVLLMATGMLFGDIDREAMMIPVLLVPALLVIAGLTLRLFFVGQPGRLALKFHLVRWRKGFWLLTGGLAILMLLVSASVTMIFEGMLRRLQIDVEPPPIMELVMSCDGTTMVALGFAVVVLAPIAEELLFRRFLFGFLAARWGTAAALVVVSLLFAAAHDSLLQFPGLFLLGVAFQLVYLHFRSLYPAILMHAYNNAIAFGAILLIRYAGG